MQETGTNPDRLGISSTDELAKIVISNISGSLGSFDSDIKALSRAVKSAMNEFTYFQTKLKSVNTETGRASLEMYVQKSELQNALNAINYRRGKWGEEHEGQYSINSSDVRYGTGYITLHGKQAQARAMAEISGIAGGQLITSPTKTNQERFQMLLPLPDDISNNDKDWINSYKKTVFSGSLKLSREENTRRKIAEEQIQQELEEKAVKRELKEIAKQKKQEDGDRLKLAKELKRLEDEERRAKERVVTNLNASLSSANRRAELERIITGEEAEGKRKETAIREKASIQTEAERKHKERKESLRKMHGMLTLATASLIGLTDIARRILANVINFNTKQFKTAVEATAVNVPLTEANRYNYFELAKGLEQGTVIGSVQDFQSAFGDITRLDEGKLEVLARVIGADVEKMVRSGLGGENPAKLMEITFDKFFEQYLSGKNSLGEAVGQTQARQELITVLNQISPQLAKLFSVATYQHSQGMDFRNLQEYYGTAPKGNVAWFDWQSVSLLGDVINGTKAQVAELKDKVLVNLSKALADFTSKVNDIRIGDNATTFYEKNKSNLKLNQEAYNRIVGTNASIETELSKQLGKYNKSLPVIEVKKGKVNRERNNKELRDLEAFLLSVGDTEAFYNLQRLYELRESEEIAKEELGKNPYGSEAIGYNEYRLSSGSFATRVSDRAKVAVKEARTLINEAGNTLYTEVELGHMPELVKEMHTQLYQKTEDEKKAFWYKKNGKILPGAYAEQAEGKEIIEKLRHNLGEAVRGKAFSRIELFKYLDEHGVDPVTLLGGTGDSNLMQIILTLGEFYGGTKAGNKILKHHLSYTEAESKEAEEGYKSSAYALQERVRAEFAEDLQKAYTQPGASQIYSFKTHGGTTVVKVDNYINGKLDRGTSGKTYTYDTPGVPDSQITLNPNNVTVE